MPRRRAVTVIVVALAGLALVAFATRGNKGSPPVAQPSTELEANDGVSTHQPGGGFGFGGRPQIVVSFDSAITDAAIETFVQNNAMTCGDRGCYFRPPFAGAAYNYPDTRGRAEDRGRNIRGERDGRGEIAPRAPRGDPCTCVRRHRQSGRTYLAGDMRFDT